MKVIMPFVNLTDFYWFRYRNQLKAIAKNVEKLYIPYLNGYRPDSEGNIVFIKIKKKLKYSMYKRIISKVSKSILKYNVLFPYLEAERMIRSLPNTEYDLLYMMSGSPIRQFVNLKVANQYNIPIVFRLRGDGKAERDVHYKRWLKKAVFNYLDNYVINKCDYVIPIKSEFIEVFNKRGIKDIGEVIPIGVDTFEFNISKLPDKISIGYAGRISKEKGIDFLFDLMEKTPNIQYHLAGMKNIEINDFPLNCEYWGVLKHSNMNKFYNKCSIIVLPSDFEGLSNTLLEAYSKGRPVIMTKEAHPEDVPVFGWEISRDLDKWEFLLNSVTRGELVAKGIKAREWIGDSNLNWSSFGWNIVSQYHKIVDSKTDWSKKVEFLQSKWTRTPDIPEYRIKMIELISEQLMKNPEWDLLDLGSGTALLYKYLPDKFKDRYLGLDRTREMIEYSKDTYKVNQFKLGNILNSFQIPERNIIVTQNVIQHNTLWQIALGNAISRAKNVVIFCERTHEEPSMIAGYNPTRWRFNINDFIECMKYFGGDQWDEPIIKGHPISTEGLENVLTIFMMKKRV